MNSNTKLSFLFSLQMFVEIERIRKIRALKRISFTYFSFFSHIRTPFWQRKIKPQNYTHTNIVHIYVYETKNVQFMHVCKHSKQKYFFDFHQILITLICFCFIHDFFCYKINPHITKLYTEQVIETCKWKYKTTQR